jgi:hypothetical protein
MAASRASALFMSSEVGVVLGRSALGALEPVSMWRATMHLLNNDNDNDKNCTYQW